MSCVCISTYEFRLCLATTNGASLWTQAACDAIVARVFASRMDGCGFAGEWRLARMSLGTLLYTWLHGELVGTDQFGNRYYREKRRRPLKRGGGLESRERRWVLYKGEVEPSRVPPLWHGWLHHIFDEVPKEAARKKYPWEKEFVPNLTGTDRAYRPPGSLLRGGHRARASGDYEPWKPD